jgi:prophage regulatory protein
VSRKRRNGGVIAPPEAEKSREPSLPTRMLRVALVCQRTGLSRTTLWRLERRGDFPSHRQLSPGAVGWVEAEVEDWLACRPRALSSPMLRTPAREARLRSG